jgi:hypothetical protein
MTVKVEMRKIKGRVDLAFECSKPEEHEILDAIRTAMMGEFSKRGGYINSNRLVIQVSDPNFDPEQAAISDPAAYEPSKTTPLVPPPQ